MVDEIKDINNNQKGLEKNKPVAPVIDENNDPKIVNFKKRFDIDFSKQISWLNNNGAIAYETKDTIGKIGALFALVSSDEYFPRMSIANVLKNLTHHNLMKLVDYGIITNPKTQIKQTVLIYERPLGGKVIEKEEDFEKFKGNAIEIEKFLIEISSALDTLRKESITHRAVRLDNLYYKDIAKSQIILGDCIASFPGVYQPDSYETIENFMTSKEGKGEGKHKDDIYSLGVVALSLTVGRELLKNKNKEEILEKKLEKDSYNALIDGEILTGKLVTSLKRMLDDYEPNRWTSTEVFDAINNNIFSKISKNNESSKKAININNKRLYSARDVAYNLYKNPSEGYELIKTGKISEWVKNGLQDEDMLKKTETIIKLNLPDLEKWEALVVKIAITLDSTLPIIFKGVGFFPDSLGKAIFHAIKKQNNLLDLYSEAITSEIIKIWYQEQKSTRSPINDTDFKNYIARKEYGYGIYRIIYEIDNDLPCISPILKNEPIYSHTRIINVLEACYENKKGDLPFDKSIIAYICSKFDKNIDKIINKINSKKESERVSGIIQLYGMMQTTFGPAKLPNLTKWLASTSSPIIQTYHNLKLKKDIEKNIIKILPQGNISSLYNIIENGNLQKKDNYDYMIAINKINKLITEKKHILNNGQFINNDSQKLGKNIISIISIIIMLISFIYSIIGWIGI